MHLSWRYATKARSPKVYFQERPAPNLGNTFAIVTATTPNHQKHLRATYLAVPAPPSYEELLSATDVESITQTGLPNFAKAVGGYVTPGVVCTLRQIAKYAARYASGEFITDPAAAAPQPLLKSPHVACGARRRWTKQRGS